MRRNFAQLTSNSLLKLPRWRRIDGRLVVTVQQSGVGTFAQQQAAHLHPTLRGGLVQRRKVPQIVGVDIGAVFDQQFGHLKVAVRAGVVQRHQPALVLGVHVGAMLQQYLNDPNSVVTGRQVQRRRPSSVRCVNVDIQRGQQSHQSVFGARTGRFEQLVFAVFADQDGPSARIGQVERGFVFGVANVGIGAVL
jgi:hypothetical protein